MSPVRKHSSIS